MQSHETTQSPEQGIKDVIDSAAPFTGTPPIQTETEAQVITRLASLSPIEYDRVRKLEAEKLGLNSIAALDKQVQSARKTQTPGNASVIFPEVTAWPDPVDGSLLLDDVVGTISRFIVCDRETAIATALWCTFTWLVEYVQVAPLAVITAPEKRCGKSQLLNFMGKLVRNPLVASNISPSAVYRVIEAYQPTLLIDEADSFFKDNEELRGVINSGHTRQSAYVIRNVGDNHEPKQFSTWGAKAISGIGALSDTLMDRAIILNLRRKLSHESVERLRHAEATLFDTLAGKLHRFALDNGTAIAAARPSLPDALHDRAQDNWEPLLAIADCAGGDWPSVARTAALKLSGAEQETSSRSTELLADIKEVFDGITADRISTADLIAALCADDEKSWSIYNRGKPITPRQFARRLTEYGIKSKTVRIDYSTPRGFEKGQFTDAFSRYLAAPPLPSATLPQAAASLEIDVLGTNRRCTTELLPETGKLALTGDCGSVADFIPPLAIDKGIVEVDI